MTSALQYREEALGRDGTERHHHWWRGTRFIKHRSDRSERNRPPRPKEEAPFVDSCGDSAALQTGHAGQRWDAEHTVQEELGGWGVSWGSLRGGRKHSCCRGCGGSLG